MPGSVIQGKEEIKRWVDSRDDIKIIVDVGAGSATYPKLLGDKYKYIGIEVWEPYLKMFDLDKYYLKLIVKDISNIKEWPEGDLIIFGDVLEHLGKTEALKVLIKASWRYKHLIISIPLGVYRSKIQYGNIYEKHISEWDYQEIAELLNWEVKFSSKNIGIFIK
jgi:hypothetical protein